MQRSLLVLGGVIAALAVIAAVVIFLPGVLGDSRPTTTVTDPAVIAKTALVFVNNPYKDDYDTMRIPGYVDNLGSADIIAVSMDVQLLDKDGNRKEVVKYVVKGVPAGGRTTFDANAGAIGDSRTAKVKVTSIQVVK